MLESIRSKLKSMETIRLLCEMAETYALRDGEQEPGAEHLLLAAFDLPDGTARLAFERVGADPLALRAAVADQYDDALRAMGIDSENMPEITGTSPLRAKRGAFAAAPSGQEVMQELSARRGNHRPLLGAHVVAVVADMPHGVVARALRGMGIDRDALKAEAEAVARVCEHRRTH
ncbi:Clp protease N-terminal domain-containing protein [Pelagerythrobacter rhizovicinus]|uniref:ATP-dependent Clp protease ATP-binding subunit n=1 Tax=Pelagerythrobacter rhizovicinus TaxID=2268576 RepID=A0A4Q2KI66_9SPHN|nr:Clp protease N-terminal domain-containing protein [Pelagerythrobacter rhizovicinus]RXZ63967.1 ATP-dependent Clp protease ATP-binding subunit [Pelagerythrobacter rhizovicinus]